MTESRVVLPGIVCVLLLAGSGCSGSKLNQTNFERLKAGMSPQQVEGILGKGAKEVPAEEVAAMLKEALAGPSGKGPGLKMAEADLSAARGSRWGDDRRSITVIFVHDRANRIFKKGF